MLEWKKKRIQWCASADHCGKQTQGWVSSGRPTVFYACHGPPVPSLLHGGAGLANSVSGYCNQSVYCC